MKRLFSLVIVILIVSVGAAFSIHQASRTGQRAERDIPLENLLPADPVLYVNWDGLDAHKESWEKTVAHEALIESGLMPNLLKLIQSLAEAAGPQIRDIADKGLDQSIQRGFTVSVVLQDSAGGPPMPALFLGLRDGDELEPMLTNLIAESPIGRENVDTSDVEGRQIHRVIVPASPGVELVWWTQGGHLLLAAGRGVSETVGQIIQGEAPNLTASKQWKRMSEAENFEVCSTFWLDFEKLASTYGPISLPPTTPDGEPVTVNQMLELLGLDNLERVVSQSGFHGEAIWSETEVVAPGERKGLLAALNSSPISLDELPPLPVHSSAFSAGRMNPSELIGSWIKIYKGLSEAAPPGQLPPLDFGLDFAREFLGFDFQPDLLAHLGDRYAVYLDDMQSGMFTPAIGVIWEVRDSEALLPSLAKIAERIEQQAPPDMVSVTTLEKQGRPFGILEFGGGFFGVSVALDKDWLVIGLSPQTVESALMRMDGKLPSWTPDDEWKAALTELPKEFTSISGVNVRSSYQALAGFVPMAVGFGRGMVTQMSDQGQIPPIQIPVLPSDFPPAELVSQNLFPSVTVSTIDETSIKWVSRSSVPGLPISNAGSMTTVPILIALLLPAVQQAREAARRSVSKNNLKQLGLAMHNYHDVHRSFPAGTIPNEKLKPEERLSWLVSLLPFYDQAPLYNRIDQQRGWKADINARFTSTQIPVLINPGIPVTNDLNAPTHYAGMAGVGKDAPELAIGHKRAGIFGIDRKTRIRDITDGTANTIMIVEVVDKLGPWAQGGDATLRSLTKKPYINGPDGIGSNFAGGCNVLFADGSVHFLSENIDDGVMEALSTMAGGERIPRNW